MGMQHRVPARNVPGHIPTRPHGVTFQNELIVVSSTGKQSNEYLFHYG
jgi:hypothetical protein